MEYSAAANHERPLKTHQYLRRYAPQLFHLCHSIRTCACHWINYRTCSAQTTWRLEFARKKIQLERKGSHLIVFELFTIDFLKVVEIILSCTLATTHWSDDLVSSPVECNLIWLQFQDMLWHTPYNWKKRGNFGNWRWCESVLKDIFLTYTLIQLIKKLKLDLEFGCRSISHGFLGSYVSQKKVSINRDLENCRCKGT